MYYTIDKTTMARALPEAINHGLTVLKENELFRAWAFLLVNDTLHLTKQKIMPYHSTRALMDRLQHNGLIEIDNDRRAIIIK